MSQHHSQPFNHSYEQLTERELEIVALLALRFSNREIAQQLYLSVNTVRWYNSQIFAKLGVKGRKQAVIQARQLGLLVDEEENKTQHNLPAEITPFIGRKSEIKDLTDLLNDSKSRLITILAAGGMGKTRLAIEVAQQQLSNYRDGIFFIDLTPLDSASYIVPLIADTVDLHFQAGREPKKQLLEYLRFKRLLLILDNFEHVLEGASIVHEILAVAPDLHILVTSRDKLALSGENIYKIHGMIAPELENVDTDLEYDAIKLFIQRATLVLPDFQPRPEDRISLSQICHLTEGMPLAIVLAAAWVDVISLADIVDEVQNTIDFLSVEIRDLPRRQRSIRAVFDSTWNRLSDDEKIVLMKFAVFRGGCNRKAAQKVTKATVQHLQVFINRALLSRQPNGRYKVHELLSQYIADHLISSPQSLTIYDTYMNYFADFLQSRDTALKGQGQTEALREIEDDFENIRSAWILAIERQKYTILNRSAESLFWYSILSGNFEGGIELFQIACESLEPLVSENENLQIWARLQTRLLYLGRWYYGKYLNPQDALADLTKCLSIAEVDHNHQEIAICQLYLGELYTDLQEFDASKVQLLICLESFHTLNESYYRALTFQCLYLLENLSGNPNVAITYLEQGLTLCREISDRSGTAMLLQNLAGVQLSIGNFSSAEQNIIEAEILSNGSYFHLMTQAHRALLSILNGNLGFARLLNTKLLDGTSYNNKSLVLIVASIMACLDGEYNKAQQLIEEGLSIAPNSLHIFFLNWCRALVKVIVGDTESAIQANHAALSIAVVLQHPGRIILCLPAAAMIEYDRKNYRQAAKLLSLAFNHPIKATGWLKIWSVISKFRNRLIAQFSKAEFNEIWDEPIPLDLVVVAEQLLVRYSVTS